MIHAYCKGVFEVVSCVCIFRGIVKNFVDLKVLLLVNTAIREFS